MLINPLLIKKKSVALVRQVQWKKGEHNEYDVRVSWCLVTSKLGSKQVLMQNFMSLPSWKCWGVFKSPCLSVCLSITRSLHSFFFLKVDHKQRREWKACAAFSAVPGSVSPDIGVRFWHYCPCPTLHMKKEREREWERERKKERQTDKQTKKEERKDWLIEKWRSS